MKNQITAWLRQAISKFPQLIPRPNLRGTIRAAKQHITPGVMLAYALVIGVGVYVNFIVSPAQQFFLIPVIVICAVLYVPTSFLLKPGWSRFFTRIVPIAIFFSVSMVRGSSQFEFWVRADKFEQDIRAAQARDSSVAHLTWRSYWINHAFIWKDFYFVANDIYGLNPQGKSFVGCRIEKLRPHFYAVTCDTFDH